MDAAATLFVPWLFLVSAVVLWFVLFRLIWSPFTLTRGPTKGAASNASGYMTYWGILIFATANATIFSAIFIGQWLTSLFYLFRDNRTLFVTFAVLTAGADLTSRYDSQILQGIDTVWTRDIHDVAADDIILPVGDAMRRAYDVGICWYNLYPETIYGGTVDAIEVLADCSLETWQETVNAAVNITVITALTFSVWIDDLVTDTGTGDWNFALIVNSTVFFIGTLLDKLDCLCEDIDFIWNVGFQWLNTPATSILIDQTLNAIIQFFKISIEAIADLIEGQPVSPDYHPVFDRLCNASLALGDFVDNAINVLILDFLFHDATLPQLGCLIGRPLCFVLRFIQVIVDILVNIEELFKEGGDFLIDDLDYKAPIRELFKLSICIDDQFNIYDQEFVEDVGCAVAGAVNITAFTAELAADIIIYLFGNIERLPGFLQETDDWINIIRAVNETAECLWNTTVFIHPDLPCTLNNVTSAGLLAVNITLELILHPELIFTDDTFLASLMWDQMFLFYEAAAHCLGDLFRSFAGEGVCTGDPEDERVLIWCCVGDFVENGIDILVGVSRLGVNLTINIAETIEGADPRLIVDSAFEILNDDVLVHTEDFLDSAVCLVALFFEPVDCFTDSIELVDGSIDDPTLADAITVLGQQIVNITLIPLFQFDDFLGFWAALEDHEEGDDDALNMLCDFDDIDAELCDGGGDDEDGKIAVCFFRDFVDTSFRPYLYIFSGVGAIVQCLVSQGFGVLLTEISRIMLIIERDFTALAGDVIVQTILIFQNIWSGDFESVAEDALTMFECLANAFLSMVAQIIDDASQAIQDAFKSVLQEIDDFLGDLICGVLDIPFVCGGGGGGGLFGLRDAPKRSVNITGGSHRRTKRYVYVPSQLELHSLFKESTPCDAIAQNYEKYKQMVPFDVAMQQMRECIKLLRIGEDVNYYLNPFGKAYPMIEDSLFYNLDWRILAFKEGITNAPRAYWHWLLSPDRNISAFYPHDKMSLVGIRERHGPAMERYFSLEDVHSRLTISTLKLIDVSVASVATTLRHMRNANISALQVKELHRGSMFNKPRGRYRRALAAAAAREDANVTEEDWQTHRQAVRQSLKGQSSISFKGTATVINRIKRSLGGSYSQFKGWLWNVTRPRGDVAIRNRKNLWNFMMQIKSIWVRVFSRNFHREDYDDRHRIVPLHYGRVLRDDGGCQFKGDPSEEACALVSAVFTPIICNIEECIRITRDLDILNPSQRERTGGPDNGYDIPDNIRFGIAPGATPPSFDDSSFTTWILDRICDFINFFSVVSGFIGDAIGRATNTTVDLRYNINCTQVITDVGDVLTNTNIDPDDGNVGIAFLAYAVLTCEYDNVNKCIGPGLADGLLIVTLGLIAFLAFTVLIFPQFSWATSYLLLLVPIILLSVSYQLSPLCFITFPPILPTCLADDAFQILQDFFVKEIPWDSFLPGLLVVNSDGSRSFVSCSSEVGFVDVFDNFFFLMEWVFPGVNNFLLDTDYFILAWIRQLPFIDSSLTQFTFDGDPTDTQKSCWIVTSLNWVPMILLVALFFLGIWVALNVFFIWVDTWIIAVTAWAFTFRETARLTDPNIDAEEPSTKIKSE